MTASSLTEAPPTAPVSDDVEALEAAYAAPAAQTRRDAVRPGDVNEVPRASWSVSELLAGALFAVLIAGVGVLIALALFG